MFSERLRRVNWRITTRSLKPDLDLKSLYDRLFLVLLAVDIVLRAIWLDKPWGSFNYTDGASRQTSSLIFDEWYYVNVARVILRFPQSLGGNNQPAYAAPLGLDPNHEHPPLAKLMIALSMYLADKLGHLFGQGGWIYNGYAWRTPSVIFGSIAILVFYLLMKKIASYKMVPLIATFLFSFDNLVFVQSRIAILDIFALTFMLLGVYWYFSEHQYLSAIAMALSALTKITGAAGLFVIVAVHIVRFIANRSKPRSWNDLFAWFEKYLVTYVASFLLILTVLDRLWVGYSNPFDHIQFILQYSAGLVSSCPNGIISCPWQWLINQIQIPYLIVNVQVTAGDVSRKFDSVAFWGSMNPAILYLTIPAMLYSAYSYYQKKSDITLFTLLWFAITYLPFYPAAIFGHRVTYLFYLLATVPAVCAGVAHMIADQNPPKLVVIFYLAVVLASFYFMFPFKVLP